MTKQSLAFECVQSDEADHVIVMLHGILGSRGNLRGFARRLVAAFPKYQVLLVDLRNHGLSHGFAPPHTVDNCAGDVLELLRRFDLKTPVLFGHSFGGKVALAAQKNQPGYFSQIWVIDSMIGAETGPEPASPKEISARQLIELLNHISLPIASRAQLSAQLQALGAPKVIAGWMTTNLIEKPEGLFWSFDRDAALEMLNSYLESSYWGVLKDVEPPTQIHLVRAERSTRWTAPVLEKIATLASAKVQLHLVANSGHWVHIDNPQGLLNLMGTFLLAF